MLASFLAHLGNEPVDRVFPDLIRLQKEMAIGCLDITIHIHHLLAVVRQSHRQIRGNGGLARSTLAAGYRKPHC